MNINKNASLAFESIFVAFATFILSLAVVNAHGSITTTSAEPKPLQQQQIEPLQVREVEATEEEVQQEPSAPVEEPEQDLESLEEEPLPPEEPKPQESKKVVVKPGDTLGIIATQHDTTYKRLYDANPQISDPDLINPGAEILIPSPSDKLVERTLPAKQAPKQSVAKIETKKIKPAAIPAKRASVTKSSNAGVWDKLAQCESSGNWSINTGNGYYGGLQFSLSSWQFVGGTGYPHQASKQEQINRAEKLLAIQGWGAWPACSAKLGLR